MTIKRFTGQMCLLANFPPVKDRPATRSNGKEAGPDMPADGFLNCDEESVGSLDIGSVDSSSHSSGADERWWPVVQCGSHTHR